MIISGVLEDLAIPFYNNKYKKTLKRLAKWIGKDLKKKGITSGKVSDRVQINLRRLYKRG